MTKSLLKTTAALRQLELSVVVGLARSDYQHLVNRILDSYLFNLFIQLFIHLLFYWFIYFYLFIYLFSFIYLSTIYLSINSFFMKTSKLAITNCSVGAYFMVEEDTTRDEVATPLRTPYQHSH